MRHLQMVGSLELGIVQLDNGMITAAGIIDHVTAAVRVLDRGRHGAVVRDHAHHTARHANN